MLNINRPRDNAVSGDRDPARATYRSRRACEGTTQPRGSQWPGGGGMQWQDVCRLQDHWRKRKTAHNLRSLPSRRPPYTSDASRADTVGCGCDREMPEQPQRRRQPRGTPRMNGRESSRTRRLYRSLVPQISLHHIPRGPCSLSQAGTSCYSDVNQ